MQFQLPDLNSDNFDTFFSLFLFFFSPFYYFFIRHKTFETTKPRNLKFEDKSIYEAVHLHFLEALRHVVWDRHAKNL